jgi:hypothetical protein
VLDVLFPVSDGAIADRIRTQLSSWVGLIVQRQRPEQMPRRLVTVRNDSGPAEDVRSLRRYGINVWADDVLEAEKIALDAMKACRARMGPVVHTDEFTGPYEVPDDPAYTVAGKTLTHFYFAFRATVRGN